MFFCKKPSEEQPTFCLTTILSCLGNTSRCISMQCRGTPKTEQIKLANRLVCNYFNFFSNQSPKYWLCGNKTVHANKIIQCKGLTWKQPSLYWRSQGCFLSASQFKLFQLKEEWRHLLIYIKYYWTTSKSFYTTPYNTGIFHAIEKLFLQYFVPWKFKTKKGRYLLSLLAKQRWFNSSLVR